MLFVAFSRIFFFDYAYEVFGEGSFYIGHMAAGDIPGLAPIYDIGINPPAIFALFYFSHHVIGLDPVVILKAFRLVLGALDVLLVFLIGRRLFEERLSCFGLGAGLRLGRGPVESVRGRPVQEPAGPHVLSRVRLVGMDWIEAWAAGEPGQWRRVVAGVALALGMILSHKVYPHVLIGILALARGPGDDAVSQRVLGRRPGLGQAVVLIAVAGFGYAFWFRELLPHMGEEGLVALTETDYGFLTLADEIRRPGIMLYNVWIVLATVGALLCARRDGARKSVAFLLTLFGFFTFLPSSTWWAFCFNRYAS